MSRVLFKSLSSGSCGNCYWLAIEDDNDKVIPIIIDAGVSPRRTKAALLAEHLDINDIQAVLVTHDHLDHIRSLGSWCKHYSKPVWATPLLHRAMAGHTMTKGQVCNCRKDLSDGWNEIVPGKIRAKYFEVPHDATQTVGYAIMLGSYKFVIMTDIGHITDEAMNFARQADTVVIESNYDLEMLRNGPYPVELQDRICLGGGHLSNSECAEAISTFASDRQDYIFLCHLSEHNNTPQKALESARAATAADVRIVPLPRSSASPLFTLG